MILIAPAEHNEVLGQFPLMRVRGDVEEIHYFQCAPRYQAIRIAQRFQPEGDLFEQSKWIVLRQTTQELHRVPPMGQRMVASA